MSRWAVYIRKGAQKVIDRAPPEIQRRFTFWLRVVRESGPEGLRAFSGFRDHALKGALDGQRSSYLNDSWRVQYEVNRSDVSVFVIEIHHHDYRSRR